MKKCISCNIEFNTNEKFCPLCQNILIGSCSDLRFPTNTRYKANSLIKKIILFFSYYPLISTTINNVFLNYPNSKQ